MLEGPTNVLRAKVTHLASPYTVRRRDNQSSGQYGQAASDDYDVLGEREVYVFRTSTRGTDTPAGEQDEARIEGYCTADTDIAEDDRIEYDGDLFEIDAPIGVPEHDPTLLRLDGEYVGTV